MSSSSFRLAVFVSVVFSCFLAGCGAGGSLATVETNSSVIPAITGMVHGGTQAVSGATIQLFAANTSTAMGASQPLLTSAVTTVANGGFSIKGDYSCTSGQLLYLVATGGNPGLGPGNSNPNLAMMAALGTCGSLTTSTTISINELTTVASVISLAPFMADLSHVGSSSTNTAGLAGAFAGAQNIVNFSTGQPPSSPTGLAPTLANLDTLADILAACINSKGGTAGDGSNCGKLFQYAVNGTPTDTISAMLHIAQLPGQNVAQLFALVSSTSPYQPIVTGTPNSLMLPLTFSLSAYYPDFPVFLAIDTAQHIWVDTQNAGSTGPILVYDTNGNLQFTIQAGSGGLYNPVQMLADPLGNVWTINGNLTLSKFGPTGVALSPPGGFTLIYTQTPPFVTVLGQLNSNFAPIGPFDSDDPSAVFAAFDPTGNLWGIGSGTTSNCVVEVSNSGSVITPSGNLCSTTNNALTASVATDGSGNIWVYGSGAIAKGSSTGAYITSGVSSNGCFSLSSTITSQATLAAETENLAYDRVHNQLWGIGGYAVGALGSSGNQIFCNKTASTLPIVLPGSVVAPDGSTEAYGVFAGPAFTLDGAGTMWFLTFGPNVSKTSTTYGVTLYDSISALDYTGKLLTPYNAASGVYGISDGPTTTLQGTVNGVTETVTTQTIGGTYNQTALAVDAYGNLWTTGTQPPSSTSTSNPASYLVKIPGIATPKLTQ